MERQDIIARLQANRAALQARGVEHVALFGSRARGDAAADSDTDVLLELSPAARLSVFDYAGLKLFVADLLNGRVDVVNRAALKPYVRPAVLADAVYAF
jgi:predicted nucleotidyltransferase